MEYFLNESNHEIYTSLDDITLHKINSWKDNKYKDAKQICKELRIYIHQIQSKWNVYNKNWVNNIPVVEIPEYTPVNINEYTKYNDILNKIANPDVLSIVSAIIEQTIDGEIIENDNDNARDSKDIEDESGVFRFGDIISQNNYLNNIQINQIKLNKNILNNYSKWFIESLFKDYNIDVDDNTNTNVNTARYSFSKLNPSVFDDALICNNFNELLHPNKVDWNNRIYREDLTEIELSQRIQYLLSNPFMKSCKKYINYMDAVILSYFVDIPNERYNESNIDILLSSKIGGFRKWLKLSNSLQNTKPNAFYQFNKSAKLQQIIYSNSKLIYPLNNNYIIGLSAYDYIQNNIINNPLLWLKNVNDNDLRIHVTRNSNDDQNSINFSVHFNDDAKLLFTTKHIMNDNDNTENEPDANEEQDPKPQENDKKEEEIVISKEIDNDINNDNLISISLTNGIITKYNYTTGVLIMYNQSKLEEYKLNKPQNDQNDVSTEELQSNPDDAAKDDNKDKEKGKDKNKDKNKDNDKEKQADTEKDENENEDQEKVELESIDVSWNKNKDTFEVLRHIDTTGILTIYYSDDSQRKLYPTSEVWYKSTNDINTKWIKVKSNGDCMEGDDMKKALNIATITDSDTNTKIVTREDNILVFVHDDGDGFVQYPDSTHIFVKSNITSKEWNLNELSLWMQNMGVSTQSSQKISNISQKTIDQTAKKLKFELIEIKYELKNNDKMPTVILNTNDNTTKVLFYDGFEAIFCHPLSDDNDTDYTNVSIISHAKTGIFQINSISNKIDFIPKDTVQNKEKCDTFQIDLNYENPNIFVQDSMNNKMSVALNGEQSVEQTNKKTIDPKNNTNTTTTSTPRLFVVYRDGTGYELLSNQDVDDFHKYLKNNNNVQILEPKPLIPDQENSPISHRYIIERLSNLPPREILNIPPVLCNTLDSKLNTFKDNKKNQISCHIYRHLLETSVINGSDIEKAKEDLEQFENWKKEKENQNKLENNFELNDISNKINEQRNKLQEEARLTPLELRVTLNSEIERSKLDALHKELQRKEQQKIDELQSKKESEQDIQQREKKEKEEKARKIRKMQQEPEKNESTDSGYFKDEIFLRDYEIYQYLAEIFGEFVNVWNKQKDIKYDLTYIHNDQHDRLFMNTLSLLKTLGNRLRDLIENKNNGNELNILLVNEELMVEIAKNEYISNFAHDLLITIGLQLVSLNNLEKKINDKDERNTDNENLNDLGYIAKYSDIFIDGGICSMNAKLDEYHSKFKQYIIQINNNVENQLPDIEYIKTFDMDLKTKQITNNDTKNIKKTRKSPPKPYLNTYPSYNAIDTPYFPPQFSPAQSTKTLTVDTNNGFKRCQSHCSCCPIDSPQRATKMDYLGRNRKHIISMDDLDNYPKKVDKVHLNIKNIDTECDVQRRIRTSSTFNPHNSEFDLMPFPSVIVQPDQIDFGDIVIGNIYRFTASLTNHGYSQARFTIDIENNNKYDDNSIHIKPYYRSGGIAPGITIMLEIEFCSYKYLGKYTNNIIIKTQKNIFTVSLSANVIANDDQNINDINDSTNGINIFRNNQNKKKRRIRCLGVSQKFSTL